MTYDVVIRGGTVIDGSGLPRYRADVGLHHGRIARIGRIRESAATVIEAEGHVIAPGFVDDLPAGARRLRQKSAGFLASIVNGEVVLREGEHTGAFPGQLLRGPLARR